MHSGFLFAARVYISGRVTLNEARKEGALHLLCFWQIFGRRRGRSAQSYDAYCACASGTGVRCAKMRGVCK